jgi:hypothetical protein
MTPPSPIPIQVAHVRKNDEDDRDLRRLRELMLGDQVREITNLRERLQLLTEQNQLLTERIKLTFQQQAQQFQQQIRTQVGPATVDWMAQLSMAGVEERRTASEASKYLVSSTLEQISKSSPGHLARVLTPVLGPTIRSYVKAIFQQLISQMDVLMRKANVVQRLWWRIDAARMGMSYAEYVVMKSTSFSVVHAQLCDRETSEVLLEAGTDLPTQSEEGEFAAQSALASTLNNKLHPEFETVRIAGKALALQIRTLGPCPQHVRMRAEHVLQEAEAVLGESESAAKLAEQAPPPLVQHLRDLVEARRESSRPIQGLICVGVLLLGLLSWGLWNYWQRRKEDRFIQSIVNSPGYMVQATRGEKGEIRVRGLKDPQAIAPELLLAEAGVSSSKVIFDLNGLRSVGTNSTEEQERNVTSKMAALEATRRREHGQLLDQLDRMEASRQALVEAVVKESIPLERLALTMQWQNSKLTISGECPEEYLISLQRTVENLKDVTQIKLNVTPQQDARLSSVRRLESLDIPFVNGQIHLDAGASERIKQIAALISEAGTKLPSGTQPPQLRLRSWPISGVWQDGNREVQMERLNIAKAELAKAGIPADRIQPGVLETTTIQSRQGVWVEWLSEGAR